MLLKEKWLGSIIRNTLLKCNLIHFHCFPPKTNRFKVLTVLLAVDIFPVNTQQKKLFKT